MPDTPVRSADYPPEPTPVPTGDDGTPATPPGVQETADGTVNRNQPANAVPGSPDGEVDTRGATGDAR